MRDSTAPRFRKIVANVYEVATPEGEIVGQVGRFGGRWANIDGSGRSYRTRGEAVLRIWGIGREVEVVTTVRAEKRAGTSGYTAHIRRSLAAYSVSVEHQNASEDVLGQLAAIQADVERQVVEVIRLQRAQGRTWGEIADDLGIFRQAAMRKYGPLVGEVEGARKRGAQPAHLR